MSDTEQPSLVKVWRVSRLSCPGTGFITNKYEFVADELRQDDDPDYGSPGDTVVVEDTMTAEEWQAIEDSPKEFEGW